jgi:hypothetical protein
LHDSHQVLVRDEHTRAGGQRKRWQRATGNLDPQLGESFHHRLAADAEVPHHPTAGGRIPDERHQQVLERHYRRPETRREALGATEQLVRGGGERHLDHPVGRVIHRSVRLVDIGGDGEHYRVVGDPELRERSRG